MGRLRLPSPIQRSTGSGKLKASWTILLALVAALWPAAACTENNQGGNTLSDSTPVRPTLTPFPGSLTAGTAAERWNDFVLAQDAQTIVRAGETPGPRASFEWPDATGPWQHPRSEITFAVTVAAGDPRIPLMIAPPAGESVLAANVLGDEGGVAEVVVAYLREGLGIVRLPHGDRKASPDDATITIVASLWRGKPLYVSPLRDERVMDPAPAVRLDETRKVTVHGYPAIMRLYSTRGNGDTYPYRVPSVALNWFEGDVAWAFQSHFLSPEEALHAAESLRPVNLR